MIQPKTFPTTPFEKPGMYVAISIMTLIDGALNILWATGGFCSIILATFGIGLLCAPVFIYTLCWAFLK